MTTRKKFNLGDHVVGFLALKQPNSRRQLLPAINGEVTYINEEHGWLNITNAYFTESFWMECVIPASNEAAKHGITKDDEISCALS